MVMDTTHRDQGVVLMQRYLTVKLKLARTWTVSLPSCDLENVGIILLSYRAESESNSLHIARLKTATGLICWSCSPGLRTATQTCAWRWLPLTCHWPQRPLSPPHSLFHTACSGEVLGTVYERGNGYTIE